MDTTNTKTFRSTKFTKRSYETSNVVACIAESAPSVDWTECDESELSGLTKLWRQGGVVFYGYL